MIITMAEYQIMEATKGEHALNIKEMRWSPSNPQETWAPSTGYSVHIHWTLEEKGGVTIPEKVVVYENQEGLQGFEVTAMGYAPESFTENPAKVVSGALYALSIFPIRMPTLRLDLQFAQGLRVMDSHPEKGRYLMDYRVRESVESIIRRMEEKKRADFERKFPMAGFTELLLLPNSTEGYQFDNGHIKGREGDINLPDIIGDDSLLSAILKDPEGSGAEFGFTRVGGMNLRAGSFTSYHDSLLDEVPVAEGKIPIRDFRTLTHVYLWKARETDTLYVDPRDTLRNGGIALEVQLMK